MGPRLTSSDQTVARSTDGAAGRSRDKPKVTPPISRRATQPITIRRIILARALEGRGMSMGVSIGIYGNQQAAVPPGEPFVSQYIRKSVEPTVHPRCPLLGLQYRGSGQ